jgi:hypothetical protein
LEDPVPSQTVRDVSELTPELLLKFKTARDERKDIDLFGVRSHDGLMPLCEHGCGWESLLIARIFSVINSFITVALLPFAGSLRAGRRNRPEMRLSVGSRAENSGGRDGRAPLRGLCPGRFHHGVAAAAP